MISLPIDDKIQGILQLLKDSSSLVLSAAPGAGKTTRLPPALVNLTANSHQQVWVLEPRRMAAIAAAHRIAEEQNWKVGQEVGYQVRFENKTSPSTKLVFLTEALLARKILQDPDLKNVGVIVLDEFHERSIHVDLALGLLKELQMLSRPDLKIVVMSATLNAKPLSEFLDHCPIVEVPGQLFELEVLKVKQSQLLRTDHQFIERMLEQIKSRILSQPAGRDILVFLPGMSEISRLQNQLESWALGRNLLILPLSGTLGLQDQLQALKPSAQRKIILSTNVAESSVTIDGVDTVIDSGLARTLRRHPKTDFEQLVVTRISKASAKQRAGRAARQFPGTCIQVWTSTDELSMPEFEQAEIHRVDLTETVLFLKKWGARDLTAFSWFETPAPEALRKSEAWLEKTGALKSGVITSHGMKLAEIPMHPRIAQLLLVSEELSVPQLGCDLCALLQERDVRATGHHPNESDMLERLELLESFREGRGPRDQTRLLETIDRASDQLRHWTKAKKTTYEISPKDVAELLLLSYPDRLCRRRGTGRRQAIMAGGRGVELAESSSVKTADFFIAIDLMETEGATDTQVRRASAIDRKQIDKHFTASYQKKQELSFDEESKNFYIEEYNSIWDIPLEDPRRRLAKPDEVEEHLPDIFIKKWDRLLQDNEELGSWWQRWLFFEQKSQAKAHWSDEQKRESLKMACLGENKWSTVVEKDLVYFFESQIAQDILKDFHRKCPARIEVPTGNKIRLHYHLDKNPHLEVRLQELFGMAQTPKVWDNQIPVTLHLLGPNYRPVQMTSDLASFWTNTYAEVKSELKARYPKHSWPDDPRTAPAVARGRPRN